MKKLVLSLAILTIFAVTSCSSDESSDSTATGINATGKVGIKFTAPKDTPLTGKNVDRGSIPITITSIKVTATNANENVLPTSTDFVFGTGTGFTTGSYFIENVTSGNNTFKAVTTSAGVELSENQITPTKTAAEAWVDTYKAKTPYAKYDDAIAGVNITLGTSQSVSFAIHTNSGRLILEATTGSTLSAMNRTITITGQKYATAGTTAPIGDPIVIDVTGGKAAVFYWSDADSNAGAHFDYTYKIYDELGTTVENTFPKSVTIKKSTGSTVRDVITYDGITESIDYATFVVDPWIEE